MIHGLNLCTVCIYFALQTNICVSSFQSSSPVPSHGLISTNNSMMTTLQMKPLIDNISSLTDYGRENVTDIVVTTQSIRSTVIKVTEGKLH